MADAAGVHEEASSLLGLPLGRALSLTGMMNQEPHMCSG